MPEFYEFFAGGGMARAGLGEGWTCRFANDIDPRKARAYRANWGCGGELAVGDVGALRACDLPGRPDLVWASFPCQDLSLAGNGAGLGGARSGAFWPFWKLVLRLGEAGRAPKLIALENVAGALTSHGGRDLEAICAAFAQAGYRFGALIIDAALFVPQSRPRLFLIGARPDLEIPPDLLASAPTGPFHPATLVRALGRLGEAVLERRVWWRVPEPPRRNTSFADLVEEPPVGVRWHSEAERDRRLALMSPLNLAKVEAARRSGGRAVGSLYHRTRTGADGRKAQRAEVRFDALAGCLRTPAGGSSRQTIIVVEGRRVRTRLISPREAARLMGLPDDYRLPEGYSEAYHLVGDGVVVPVVRRLAAHIFEPLLAHADRPRAAPEPAARTARLPIASQAGTSSRSPRGDEAAA